MGVQAKTKAAKASKASGADAYGDLPGVLPPLNWFDPAGFAADVDEGKLLFYREAELKHGRVCMLATLGFLVQERFHPFFGGWDGPALQAVVQKDVLLFWP